MILSLMTQLGQAQTWRVQQERSGSAPLFEGENVMTGELFRLEDHIGTKIVLINFWADWCGACLLELPELADLQTEFVDELIIIGVAVDSDEDEVQDLYWEEELNYPVIMGNDELKRRFGGISATPTTFVIGLDGDFYSTIIGYRNYERLKAVIESVSN